MADWEYHIDLKEIWKDYDEETIDVVTAGKNVAQKLRGFKAQLQVISSCFDDLDEIIFLFEHESETEEEFNFAMSELYNWGDTDMPTPPGKMQRKLAFIHTTF